MVKIVKNVDIVAQAVFESARAQEAVNQSKIDYISMMSGIEIPENKEDLNEQI